MVSEDCTALLMSSLASKLELFEILVNLVQIDFGKQSISIP
jgi:hypothetical protein